MRRDEETNQSSRSTKAKQVQLELPIAYSASKSRFSLKAGKQDELIPSVLTNQAPKEPSVIRASQTEEPEPSSRVFVLCRSRWLRGLQAVKPLSRSCSCSGDLDSLTPPEIQVDSWEPAKIVRHILVRSHPSHARASPSKEEVDEGETPGQIQKDPCRNLDLPANDSHSWRRSVPTALERNWQASFGNSVASSSPQSHGMIGDYTMLASSYRPPNPSRLALLGAAPTFALVWTPARRSQILSFRLTSEWGVSYEVLGRSLNISSIRLCNSTHSMLGRPSDTKHFRWHSSANVNHRGKRHPSGPVPAILQNNAHKMQPSRGLLQMDDEFKLKKDHLPKRSSPISDPPKTRSPCTGRPWSLGRDNSTAPGRSSAVFDEGTDPYGDSCRTYSSTSATPAPGAEVGGLPGRGLGLMAPSLCSVSSATRFICGGFAFSSIRGLLGSATEKKDLKSKEAEHAESPATQPDAALVYGYMNGDLITYGFRLVEAKLLVLGMRLSVQPAKYPYTLSPDINEAPAALTNGPHQQMAYNLCEKAQHVNLSPVAWNWSLELRLSFTADAARLALPPLSEKRHIHQGALTRRSGYQENLAVWVTLARTWLAPSGPEHSATLDISSVLRPGYLY
ncbi:uncharacterized protein CLUP02_00996 [Colletotrichum lupini]|uniref:Uncharacterized protein n=1 Tax=Colletotrichum lupini TaxID=145971 RepID=A0A9Q8W862_9PEZI|nr:uncharacterized protein CLUP02_00996 [Colletotrichum lupini]UQC74348.1 hypothetical protein CLUP02_00996 [Colletotrichum lupini]